MNLKNRNLPHEVRVGNTVVGPGHPVFVIAEIGNNHNGSFELGKKAVDAAHYAGADAVKLQKRIPELVFTKEMLGRPQHHSQTLGRTYGEYRKAQELDDADLVRLKEYAHSLGLVFFVTPFDLKSAEILDEIGMDAWKVASFDLKNKELLEFLRTRKEPIFLSTGMSTLEDIDTAVEIITEKNPNLIINHCVSIYPTPSEDLNLGKLTVLMERYAPLPVGYSGHEIGFVPTVAAIAMGATTVERHFTTDKTLPGPDHATVSLDPVEFRAMTDQIRIIERSIQDKAIRIHEREVPIMQKHGKSLVARVDIPRGTVITNEMVIAKSPGTGIKPTLIHTIIGRVTKVEVPEDTVLSEAHFT